MLTLLQKATVIPVITVNERHKAQHIVQCMVDSGITTIEIVLRTPQALDILNSLSTEFPACTIGLGTVLNATQVTEAKAAGAKFIVSPGCTEKVIHAAKQQNLPLLPGVATPSDIMRALEYDFEALKIFPAEAINALALIKTYAQVFPHVKFCPTGGISPSNLIHYWQQKNVFAIGGTWITPEEDIQKENWAAITERAQQALALLKSVTR